MSNLQFHKPFTQQEAIPEDAIEAAVAVMRSGRLHRYNTAVDEIAETALLEQEYAAWQDVPYCLATTSGGTAMQIALRAAGVEPGDTVLTNAFTLAPVPGAISAVGARPVFIETTENLTLDLDHLQRCFAETNAKYFLISHMRGHLADMEAVCSIVEAAGAVMIEDCAHTMGAKWKGTRSGNFGIAACFSTQTYKHINSGEGGLLTSSDGELMARATILSGSYMLFSKHGARPDVSAFENARFQMPNCSSRMDNLRAAILRPQLANLDRNINRWNERYSKLEDGLANSNIVTVPTRPEAETYVGSSFQFLVPEWSDQTCRDFVANCAERGVELKWFGDPNPVGFTSRYDSWAYAESEPLDGTIGILGRTMDLRVPLSFDVADCEVIAQIVVEEAARIVTSA
jgi:dTDP-4-amino-4,6-dideoxygalactose transaminase